MKTVFNMKNNNNNTTTKMNFSHWNIWALSKCTHALLLCKIHHKMKKKSSDVISSVFILTCVTWCSSRDEVGTEEGKENMANTENQVIPLSWDDQLQATSAKVITARESCSERTCIVRHCFSVLNK